MSDADKEFKAEIFFKLAERAWARCESRRAVEFKTALALWAALGGATAVVLNSEWSPTAIEAWAVTAFSLAAFCIDRYWIEYLWKSWNRDSKMSYYWESGLESLAGNEYLTDQSYRPPGDWPRIDAKGPLPPWKRDNPYWVHLSVTGLLAVSLAFATWSHSTVQLHDIRTQLLLFLIVLSAVLAAIAIRLGFKDTN